MWTCQQQRLLRLYEESQMRDKDIMNGQKGTQGPTTKDVTTAYTISLLF